MDYGRVLVLGGGSGLRGMLSRLTMKVNLLVALWTCRNSLECLLRFVLTPAPSRTGVLFARRACSSVIYPVGL